MTISDIRAATDERSTGLLARLTNGDVAKFGEVVAMEYGGNY